MPPASNSQVECVLFLLDTPHLLRNSRDGCKEECFWGTADKKEVEENGGEKSGEEADVGDKVGRRGDDEEDVGPKTLEGDSTNQEVTDAERWKAARLHEKDPGAEETLSERKDREEEPGVVGKPRGGGETTERPSHVPGGVWLHKVHSYLRRVTCLEDNGGVVSEG
ncbi:hypothetical protein NDU88_006414 [Pleurodeles waltl]|uniref:Uncharacterized protein n=1 Tax=Pleurodeles waltl TaxID=8319 RepID=A0AAV7NUC3_PLEWA|nr:hypothetical protein NDU88_006414 [Pleurodeles waltl]